MTCSDPLREPTSYQGMYIQANVVKNIQCKNAALDSQQIKRSIFLYCWISPNQKARINQSYDKIYNSKSIFLEYMYFCLWYKSIYNMTSYFLNLTPKFKFD